MASVTIANLSYTLINGNTYMKSSTSGQGYWLNSNTYVGAITGPSSNDVLVFDLSNASNVVSLYNNQNVSSGSWSKPASPANSTGTWTGLLPGDFMRQTRQQIDANTQEIYKLPGTISHSFDSHYQGTMLSGVLVAMLGTALLYYTFKNI
jgi:hypothetical protein